MLALIGDIHGCLRPLEEIVEFALDKSSTLVFLGDYVNRGRDSSGVIELLTSLRGNRTIETHFLEGNHDAEFRNVLAGGSVDTLLRMGGARTIRSYVDEPFGDVGAQLRSAIPSHHLAFFESLEPTFEADGLLAAHAAKDDASARYLVAGHSPRASLIPEIGRESAFIDTGCGTLPGGRLTCLFWPSLEWVQSTTTWLDD